MDNQDFLQYCKLYNVVAEGVSKAADGLNLPQFIEGTMPILRASEPVILRNTSINEIQDLMPYERERKIRGLFYRRIKTNRIEQNNDYDAILKYEDAIDETFSTLIKVIRLYHTWKEIHALTS